MNAQEKAVYILKADSIEIAGGWLQNNWFGTFKEFAMDGHTMRIMDGFIYPQIPRMESGHGHGIVDGYGQEKEFIHFSIRKILEIGYIS